MTARILALVPLFACTALAGTVSPRLDARDFDLRDVRLLDGPFRDAQERDKGYILRVDVDRMMHWFRVNNGLPSSAQPYSEWKADDYGQQGHYQGHYLSACAQMYASTGDARFKERIDRVVAILAECQAKHPSGFVAPFPEQWMRRMAGLTQEPATPRRLPVPWYALHKVYQGLIDAYTLAGNRQALDVMVKTADWIDGLSQQTGDVAFQKMLDEEHGGINEALANLHAVTGDPRHLALARRFCHRKVMDPLARGEDVLDGLHANTQVPKFTGFARIGELCDERVYRDAALNFWRVVVTERSYANGGNSDREHFTPKARLSYAISAGNCETCNSHNMLKLTRRLFMQKPSGELADYFEKAQLNHILSSQSPVSGTVTYFHGMEGGSRKGFGSGTVNFGCCHASGMENHAKYGDSIYFRRGTNQLFVNLFIASELKWNDAGLTIRQTTKFPEEQASALAVACERPVTATISVRKPAWAGARFAVTVNGERASQLPGADGFVHLNRMWKNGDAIAVALPMTLRWEAFRDNPGRAAVLYGPVLLVATTDEACRLATVRAPAAQALAALRPADRPLHFDADPAIFRRDVTAKPVCFQPLYQTVGEFYSVYWDEQTDAERTAALRVFEAEAARWRELAPRTVDIVYHQMGSSAAANNLPGRFAVDTSMPRTAGADRTEVQHQIEAQVGYNSELNLIQRPTAALSQTFRTIEKGMDRFGWTLNLEPGRPQILRVRLWSPAADDPEARRATSCGLEVKVAGLKSAPVDAAKDGKSPTETEGNQFASAGKAAALPPLTSLGTIGRAPADGTYRDVEFPLPESLTTGNDLLLVRFVRQKDKVPGLVGEVRVLRSP